MAIENIEPSMGELPTRPLEEVAGYSLPQDIQLPGGEPMQPVPSIELPTSAAPNWFHRHRGKLALAALATSVTLTFLTNPVDETYHKIEHEVPYVGIGMLAMEGAWIGGAGMMGASVGKTTKNPLQIKSEFKEIAARANESKLFQAGFWINTAGAVGEFVIPAAAVCTKLPIESWGILGPSLIDLGATVVIRTAIRQTVKDNSLE